MFHANYFTFGVSQSIGETAIAATLTAARWGVLAWDWYIGAFFSDAAMARYNDIGKIVGFLAVVIVAAGMTARIVTQSWVDAQVDQALPAPVTAVVDTTAPAQPASVVSVTVPLPAPETPLTGMGIRQLKALASDAKVKGYGRMTKTQLIAALEELRE